MCFKCELRDRARAGDDEAQQMLDMLKNDELTSVWPVIVGELMLKLGVSEVCVDLDDVDLETHAGLMVKRDNSVFSVSLADSDQVAAVKELGYDYEVGGPRVVN
jgi:hypothetical protein